MSSLILKIGGTGGAKKFSPLPGLAGALYAGWLLGTDFHGAAAFTGSSVTDLSGNGRDLTLTGGGIGTKSMACSTSNFMTMPITGAALFGTLGATLITVTRAPATVDGFHEIGGLRISNGTAKSMSMLVATGAALLAYNHGGGAVTLNSSVARSIDVHEFHAMSISPSGALVYRRTAAMSAAETISSATAWDVTSAVNMRIGMNVDGVAPWAAPGNVTAALLANKPLTQAQIDAAYSELKALLAIFSVAI